MADDGGGRGGDGVDEGGVGRGDGRLDAAQDAPGDAFDGGEIRGDSCFDLGGGMPAGRRMSTLARAAAGMRFMAVPPATWPMLTVTCASVSASPAPPSGSEMGRAAAMAAVTAAGAMTGMPRSLQTASSAARRRSMALTPRWTWAPWPGRPAASSSIQRKPFSPKRITAGDPASPMMTASPRVAGTWVSSQCAPS